MDNIFTLARIFGFLHRNDRLTCRLVCSLTRVVIDTDQRAWGIINPHYNTIFPIDNQPFHFLFLNTILYRSNLVELFRAHCRVAANVADMLNINLTNKPLSHEPRWKELDVKLNRTADIIRYIQLNIMQRSDLIIFQCFTSWYPRFVHPASKQGQTD
jgi:hypothetical protein